MLGAVGLHDQTTLETHEVDDVTADRMLTAESHTELVAAQPPPQQRLSIGLLMSHPPCEAPLPLWDRMLGHQTGVSALRV